MNFIKAPDGALINLERLTSIRPPRGNSGTWQVVGGGPLGHHVVLFDGSEADCQRFWEQIKERVGVSQPDRPLIPGRQPYPTGFYGEDDPIFVSNPKRKMDNLPPDPKRTCPQCGAINASPGFMCCGYGRG